MFIPCGNQFGQSTNFTELHTRTKRKNADILNRRDCVAIRIHLSAVRLFQLHSESFLVSRTAAEVCFPFEKNVSFLYSLSSSINSIGWCKRFPVKSHRIGRPNNNKTKSGYISPEQKRSCSFIASAVLCPGQKIAKQSKLQWRRNIGAKETNVPRRKNLGAKWSQCKQSVKKAAMQNHITFITISSARRAVYPGDPLKPKRANRKKPKRKFE